MREVQYVELNPTQQRLLDAAAKVMETAYNPYSKFYVGAAILGRKGEIIPGSNVENAAYGSTLCAERAAILRANSMGIRMIEKIAIIARGQDFETQKITGPCGSCRQVLFEYSQISEKDLEIILSTTAKDKIIITTISELLPLAFGPKDLGIDVKEYQK